MRHILNLGEDGEKILRLAQEKTGLDLKGVFNEALSIYARALEARELEGKELALVSEQSKTYSVIEASGLNSVQLKVS